MLNQVVVPTVFGPLPGPVALNLLDGNFNALLTAINDASLGSNYLLDTGPANAITLSTAVGTTFSYTAGVQIQFKANTTNSGATTINVNALGAKPLVASDGTSPMIARSIVTTEIYTAIYDGTAFRILGNQTALWFDAGTAGNPGIRFTLKPATGVWLLGQTDLAFMVNGSTVWSAANSTGAISQGLTTIAAGTAKALAVQAPDNGVIADFSTNNTAVSGGYISLSNNGTIVGILASGGVGGFGAALGDFAVGNNGNANLIFGTNGVKRVNIAGTGAVVVSAPTSGVALQATGIANQYSQNLIGSTAASQSFGLYVQAGTSSSDRALSVANAGNTATLFEIRGDGNVNLNFVATTTVSPGAGGGGALPATPIGYFTLLIGGNARKIAYY